MQEMKYLKDLDLNILTCGLSESEKSKIGVEIEAGYIPDLDLKMSGLNVVETKEMCFISTCQRVRGKNPSKRKGCEEKTEIS